MTTYDQARHDAIERREALEIRRRRANAVHELDSGRWIVAEWSDRHAQYQTPNVDTDEVPFLYAFAPTLDGLAKFPGIRTYSTRKAAQRAARRVILDA